MRFFALAMLGAALAACVEPVPLLCDAGEHPCSTGCCDFITDHFDDFSAEPQRIRVAVDAAGRAHVLLEIPDQTLALHYVRINRGGTVDRSELLDGDVEGGFDLALDLRGEPHILYNDAGEDASVLRLGRFEDGVEDGVFESISLAQTSIEHADIAAQDEQILVAFAQPEFVEGAAGVFLIRGDFEHEEIELAERIADLDPTRAIGAVDVLFDSLGRPVVSWSVDAGSAEHDVFVQRAFASAILVASGVAGVLRADIAPDNSVALVAEAPVDGVPSLVTLSAKDERGSDALGVALGDLAYDAIGQLHLVRAGDGEVSYEIINPLGERVRTNLGAASPGSVAVDVDGLGSPRVVFARPLGFSVTR